MDHGFTSRMIVLVMVSLAILIFGSSMVAARLPSQIDQEVNSIIATNFTTSAAAERWLLTQLLRIRYSAYSNDWYPGEPLQTTLATTNEGLGLATTSLIELRMQVAQLNARIDAQDKELQTMKTQLSTQTSLLGSTVSSIGRAFKSLGETILGETPSTPIAAPIPVLTAPVQSPTVTTPSPTPSPTTPTQTPGNALTPTQLTISAPSETNQPAVLAIDGNPLTYYAKSYGARYPVDILTQFGSATPLSKIEFTARNLEDDLLPEAISVYGSDDGQAYTYEGERALPRLNRGLTGSVPGFPTAHTFWKVTFVAKARPDPRQLQFAEVKFYG